MWEDTFDSFLSLRILQLEHAEALNQMVLKLLAKNPDKYQVEAMLINFALVLPSILMQILYIV